jgi:hypothetical protein
MKSYIKFSGTVKDIIVLIDWLNSNSVEYKAGGQMGVNTEMTAYIFVDMDSLGKSNENEFLILADKILHNGEKVYGNYE